MAASLRELAAPKQHAALSAEHCVQMGRASLIRKLPKRQGRRIVAAVLTSCYLLLAVDAPLVALYPWAAGHTAQDGGVICAGHECGCKKANPNRARCCCRPAVTTSRDVRGAKRDTPRPVIFVSGASCEHPGPPVCVPVVGTKVHLAGAGVRALACISTWFTAFESPAHPPIRGDRPIKVPI